MMNRFILIAFAALMFSGCAVLDTPVGSNPFEGRPAQALAVTKAEAVTATLEPTMTPTGTPSPTAIDYGDLPITETAVALEQASIRNEREKLQVRETGQALDRNQAEQTAMWGVPTQTAEARGTMTAVAWVVETQAAQKTAVAEEREADAHDVWLNQEAVKAAWMPWVYGLGMGAGLLLAVLAAAWLRAGYAAKMAERRVYEQPPKPLQVDMRPVEQVSVKIDRRDELGFGAVDTASLPISHEMLVEVAELLAVGARFTQAQMTGAGRPLVKDGSYNQFGNWMVKQGIAVQLEDGRYQIQHPEFFEQVLAR